MYVCEILKRSVCHKLLMHSKNTTFTSICSCGRVLVWSWCREKELNFKLSFLVHLSSWNTSSMGNGLLWQTEFLGWQTVLFSLLVPLSVLIEIFCHRLEADAKQGCWPPCMCLSLSPFIQVGRSGDVRNQRWREREINKKRRKGEVLVSSELRTRCKVS